MFRYWFKKLKIKLQKYIFIFNVSIQTYNFKVKEKIMIFKGRHFSKIQNYFRKQFLGYVLMFLNLECNIRFNYNADLEEKVRKFNIICGTFKRTFKSRVRKDTEKWNFKIIAIPTLLYGSETWIPTQKNINNK